MAIDFPASPSTDDTHTVGTTTFTYNGTYWARSANTSKFSASDTVPSNPSLGDLWYESDTGKAFIYYDNIWAEIGHASDGQTFQVSDTAPSTGNAGDMWYESDTGKTFIRYDSAWVEVGHASDGQSFTVGDAAPGSPTAGDIWFESDSGGAYIYYADGSSSQWVELGHSVSGVNINIDGGVSSTNYGGMFALDAGTA
jgi:hypothetical protein